MKRCEKCGGTIVPCGRRNANHWHHMYGPCGKSGAQVCRLP